MTSTLVLQGCNPVPLASYLKALGVFRLLHEHGIDVGAAWQGETFTLSGDLDRHGLADLLLNQYRPSPVIAPWNGGSGFFDKDNKAAMDRLRAGGADRFADYRETLSVADAVLQPFGRDASPKDDAKRRLITQLRNHLPEPALAWLDAAVLLTGEDVRYPPLLGTGGNDGRLDFTNNFMQRLTELLDADSGAPREHADALLWSSLFGTPVPALARSAIGQFSPGQVGGPNASAGFDADSLINPWDFILMIEGALAYAASATRRNQSDTGGGLSFPFSVRPTGAGSGQLTVADEAPARAEIWMPLWSRTLRWPELLNLLREGRVTLGRRPPRDGLEFARAVQRLGVDRGVSAFQRYAFLMRSGKAYLATPLSRVRVSKHPQPDLVDELDRGGWLSVFHRLAKADKAPARLKVAAQQLDDALFDLVAAGADAARAQRALLALAAIQQRLAQAPKLQEAIAPVPRLSARWATQADDGSLAFRIAAALAGLHGEAKNPLPMHCHLWPVHPHWHDWLWRAREQHPDDRDANVRLIVQGGGLIPRLIEIAERRLWLAERLEFADKPFVGAVELDAADLMGFLQLSAHDARIDALLPALALCELRGAIIRPGLGAGVLPAAVGYLKLLCASDRSLRALGLLADNRHAPVPAGLLRRLRADRSADALRASLRRLRASGLAPLARETTVPALPAGMGPRLAASALLPLRFPVLGALGRDLTAAARDRIEPTH